MQMRLDGRHRRRKREKDGLETTHARTNVPLDETNHVETGHKAGRRIPTIHVNPTQA